MSFDDLCKVMGLIGDVCLVLLVVIVPIAAPRRIERVIKVLEEIRDQKRQ